jgi:hypothetical protein
MRYTPENITELAPNEIFVFGSNKRGIHGAGAARVAVEKFGAHYGEGEGLQGKSYAFPTKDENIETLPLDDIEVSVLRLIAACKKYPQKTFLLTKVGCGLACYSVESIANLFKSNTPLPKNLILPKEFADIIYSNLDKSRKIK